MKVIKRDGREVTFDVDKVVRSISKANEEYKELDDDKIIELAGEIWTKCRKLNRTIKVEDIQSIVENVLVNEGCAGLVKSYILYGKQRARIHNAENTLVDYKKIIDSYLNVEDWRVKENSTVTYSVGGLILSNSGAVTANYWLSEIYDDEIGDAHRNADIHIHDLSMLTGYCAGWSLKQLIKEGLGGVPGKITSSPAGHLSTLCNQMVNFLGIMQNEWAGAQAFSSFDTYLAPFVKVDNLSYKEVKQCIQSFIYGVNTPSRWGTQAPFTNITLDWVVPNDLAEMNAIVGGKEMDFKYKDCVEEMAMINKAFIEIMIEGDANGRGFQYPIPTYSITRDFDWSETEDNKLLFEMTAKYGTPYFSNYINSDMEPSDVRSMCITDDSMVWCKLNGKTRHCTIKELYDSTEYSKQILTKYGYRDIKELQRFGYQGDLLKFTTETGKEIISTLDHEHVIYNNEELNRDNRLWITDGNVKRWISNKSEIPDGFEPLHDVKLIDRAKNLIKKKAFEIKVGDYFSCRIPNPGESRKDLTYEDIYGKDKAAQLRDAYSKQRTGRVAWNKGTPMEDSVKDKISQTLKGHYVTENCRRKSSERWTGMNNPIHSQKYWEKACKGSCLNSPLEFEFMKELDALGYVEGEDYIHQYCIDNYISDFYIPEKNLVIELETSFLGYSYNNSDYRFRVSRPDLVKKYEYIKQKGFNLLVFNPTDGTDSYRKYINNCEKIVDITPIPFDGYVYDLEVDCDDLDVEDTTMYHTFYANEILTGNCCRLRLDLRELRKKSGGFFGSGESTGSVGVVTINMPRIAYLSATEEEFYDRLKHLMDISARSLKVKRDTITKLLDAGLYPYTKRYLGTFANHFSTIGLVGMNEACLNAKWIKKDLTQPEAQTFTKNVLNFMRNKLSDYQEMYGDLYNLEATPAESTSFRLAKHDKKRYPDIITASDCDKTPYYTNSSHLPVGFTDDIFSALDIQDELQTLYTSGTVFHAFLGQKLPDWKAAASLVRKIAENYKLPYYTMSPTYSVCADHGYIPGEVYKCPVCGKTTEVYSRITGYYRPVQNWNDGKRAEFAARKVYDVANSHFTRNEEKCECCGDIGVSEDMLSKESDNTDILTRPLLFTRTGCPNCKTSKMMLDKAGVKYDVVNAEEDKETTLRFGVKKAPTLLVPDGDGFKAYDNASEIRKYIENIH